MAAESVSSNPTRLRPRQVFLAFEGGGAAGVAHIGALRAFESAAHDPKYRMVVGGYSGTSAGAIVAALAAVGYTADEMILPEDGLDGSRTLLDKINGPNGKPFKKASRLFGSTGWIRITAAVRVMRHHRGVVIAAIAISGVLVYVAWLLFTVMLDRLFGRFDAGSGFVAAAIAMAAALFVVSAVLWFVVVLPTLRGLARTDTLRNALNDALLRKLSHLPAQHQVSFDDLPRGVDLKIVATNISDGRLEIYSRHSSPSCLVTDAVAASVCLPVIFKPKRLNEKLHFDGGLVCNLPAWPFDEERLLDRDAITIGFSVASKAFKHPVTEKNWIVPTLRTSVFGSDMLNTRGIGRIEIVRLTTSIGLLDFDLPLSAARKEVERQTEAARLRLNAQLLALPRMLYLRTAQIALLFRAALRDCQPSPRRFRVAIALPEDHVRGGFLPSTFPHDKVRSFVLRYGFGYRDQPDEGLTIPSEGTVIGEAFRAGQARFESIQDGPERYAGPLSRHMRGMDLHNRLRHRQMPTGLAWVLAVPVPVPGPELDDANKPVALEGVVVVTSFGSVPKARVLDLVPAVRTLLQVQE